MTSFFTGFYLLTKRHKFFTGCVSRELSAPRRWHPSLLCQNAVNAGTLRRKMPWMLLGMQCRSRVHRFFNSSALSIQKGKIGRQRSFLPIRWSAWRWWNPRWAKKTWRDLQLTECAFGSALVPSWCLFLENSWSRLLTYEGTQMWMIIEESWLLKA